MTKALLNLKMELEVREEFHLAAALRGATVSSMVHQYAFQIIREERGRYPAAFIYLNAGGSIDSAVKVARKFGNRDLSDEDRAEIQKMAEVEKEEKLKIIKAEEVINGLTQDGPLVNEISNDRPRPKRGRKPKRA
jgi:hypothetical protein